MVERLTASSATGMSATARVHVFACGDPLRGDDGAARAAVAELSPTAALDAALHVVDELAIDDLLALGEQDRAIVVDAVVGIPAGQLVILDLERLPSAAARFTARSTHELPLDQVVGLAMLLGGGVRGTFLGIGGLAFELGQPLSEPVRQGLPALRAALTEAIRTTGTERRGADD